MSDIRPASDFTLDVYERFFPPSNIALGQATQWGKLPFRFFKGDMSVYTGINGHGKSLFLTQLLVDLTNNGENGLIASFEMPGHKTLYRAVRQALGKDEPSPDEITACMEWLGKRLFIYDKVHSVRWKTLFAVFDEAREQCGVTHILIDSLMKCGIAPDDYNTQTEFVDSLQNYTKAHNIHIHLVAHARKLQGEEDKPGKMDVKGAGELTNIPDNVFSIWRDKKKEYLVRQYFDTHQLPNGITIEKLWKKYDCVVECSKHREMGNEGEGQFGLYFHKPSMQFIEKQDDPPFVYCKL